MNNSSTLTVNKVSTVAPTNASSQSPVLICGLPPTVSDTLITADFAQSYGGLPSIFLVNFLPLLVCFFCFVLVWYLLGKIVDRTGFGRNAMASARGLFNQIYPRIPQSYCQRYHRGQKHGYFNRLLCFDRRHMLKVYGIDSFSYLCFQRYMIVFLLVVTLGATLVLLPVNVMAGQVKDLDKFEAGTAYNVRQQGNLLAVHVIFAWLMTPLSMVIMSHFARNIVIKHTFAYNSRVLWLQKLPEDMRSRDKINGWLDKKYPGHDTVESIFLTYKTNKLYNLHQQKLVMSRALHHATKRTVYHPFRCCGCCGYCERTCSDTRIRTASEYYKMKIEEIAIDIGEAAKDLKSQSPLSSAFIVFATDAIPISSFETDSMFTAEKKFDVNLAPPLQDLQWRNFDNAKNRRRRHMAFFFVAAIMAIFATTPYAVVLAIIEVWILLDKDLAPKMISNGPIVSHEFGAVVLYAIGRVVQMIACAAVLWLGQAQESKANILMLRLTTTYLIFAIIVSPTLSLPALHYVVVIPFSGSNLRVVAQALSCTFDSVGSLKFMRYLISAALVGNACELLQFQAFFNLAWQMATAKTWAEVVAWSRHEKTILWFGDYYSFDVLHLTIAVTMSPTTPLMAPLGLFYFLAKFAVSVHTLHTKVALGTKVSEEFHRSAVSFVVGATLVAQFYTAVFVNLHQARGAVAVLSAFLALSSLLVFVLELDSDWTWPLPVFPFNYAKVERAPVGQRYCPDYLPAAQFGAKNTADATRPPHCF